MHSYELRSKHPKWISLITLEYEISQGYSKDAELLNKLRDEIDNDITNNLKQLKRNINEKDIN